MMSASMTREEMEKMLSSIPLDVLFEYTWLRFSQTCHENAAAKGFWDNDHNIAEMICLMHSELSKCLEEHRTETNLSYPHLGPMSKKIPTFRGMEEEIADLLIRTGDFCAGLGLNGGGATVAKMAYNQGRPRMHGKTL